MKNISKKLKYGLVAIIVLLAGGGLWVFNNQDSYNFAKPAETENQFLSYSFWATATFSDVQHRIARGADINASDGYGETALMFAARFSQNLDVMKMLIEAGADIDARNKSGKTALMYIAKFNRNPDIVTSFIEAGADVNAKDNSSKTALMYAAWFNQNPDIVTSLIEAGANMQAYDAHGNSVSSYILKNTALHGTDIYKQHLVIDEYFWQNASIADIKFQIAQGIDVNMRDSDGKTALMYLIAGYNSRPDIITLLIEVGVDVNVRDNDGRTALMYAAEEYNFRPDIMTLLIEADADLNVIDNDGKTALFLTMWQDSDNLDTVRMLVDAGADVRIKSKYGDSAYDYFKKDEEQRQQCQKEWDEYDALGGEAEGRDDCTGAYYSRIYGYNMYDLVKGIK